MSGSYKVFKKELDPKTSLRPVKQEMRKNCNLTQT